MEQVANEIQPKEFRFVSVDGCDGLGWAGAMRKGCDERMWEREGEQATSEEIDGEMSQIKLQIKNFNELRELFYANAKMSGENENCKLNCI